jgi:hypothetical protein
MLHCKEIASYPKIFERLPRICADGYFVAAT